MKRRLDPSRLGVFVYTRKEAASNINSGIQDSLSISSMASNSAPLRRSMAAERGCVNLRYYAERGV